MPLIREDCLYNEHYRAMPQARRTAEGRYCGVVIVGALHQDLPCARYSAAGDHPDHASALRQATDFAHTILARLADGMPPPGDGQ